MYKNNKSLLKRQIKGMKIHVFCVLICTMAVTIFAGIFPMRNCAKRGTVLIEKVRKDKCYYFMKLLNLS
jgi:hypothetical protein